MDFVERGTISDHFKTTNDIDNALREPVEKLDMEFRSSKGNQKI